MRLAGGHRGASLRRTATAHLVMQPLCPPRPRASFLLASCPCKRDDGEGWDKGRRTEGEATRKSSTVVYIYPGGRATVLSPQAQAMDGFNPQKRTWLICPQTLAGAAKGVRREQRSQGGRAHNTISTRLPRFVTPPPTLQPTYCVLCKGNPRSRSRSLTGHAFPRLGCWRACATSPQQRRPLNANHERRK